MEASGKNASESGMEGQQEQAVDCTEQLNASAIGTGAGSSSDKDGTVATVSFLATDKPLDPYQAKEEGFFPPTLYSDKAYNKGIRVFPIDTVTVTEPEYGNVIQRVSLDSTEQPDAASGIILDDEEITLWQHKWAAKTCCQHQFPMTAFRLLGTISRNVFVANDSPLGPFAGLGISQEILLPSSSKGRKPQKITRASAKKEARLEGCEGEDVELRADEIQSAWAEKLLDGKLHKKGWDVNGELCRDAVNDDDYIPVHHLRKWIVSSNAVDDPGEPSTRLLYNGLRTIPVDTQSILNSLLELSCPTGLYSVPLILPYAVATVAQESQTSYRLPSNTDVDEESRLPRKARKVGSFQRTWRIRVGVYMNRLLPEVLTSQDLHVIMSALDDGSFRLKEPIHIPPTPRRPTFQSSPFPEVVFDGADNRVSSSDDEDLTIGDSTREEKSILAFTIKGFLRLMENTGNDVSNWSFTEAKISPTVKLDLMLHQKHAVSWMLQMESLGGYGINSILWEEREFLDGGKYYYSPALGQLRLRAPPTMKGGILADEMGLGKTLVVLSLVAASLDELKHEADVLGNDEKSGEALMNQNKTHATLIVVPPALVGQWLAEIQKTVGDELTVEFFDCKCKSFVHKIGPEGMPDIVVTAYTALEKKETARQLLCWSWGRIVLDEMQEIRSSTAQIAKLCDSLDCGRRWMLSGTPLFDGISDLRGELNFLRLEPFAASTEDGFFDFSISSHWEQQSLHGMATLRVLGLLMLRRSKSMTIVENGHPLLGLKPLTVEYLPIAQDPSERALYCYMESLIGREMKTLKEALACNGATRQLCLRLLRELCMTPILLSGGMGAQSQLATLNRLMVNENRREMSQLGFSGLADSRSNRLSCDEAIRFLSQAQEAAFVGSDFVTSQAMGIGAGISHRSRAVEAVAAKIEEAKDCVENARATLIASKKKRARAHWHFALEKVTSGQAPIPKSSLARINSHILRLWKWRLLVVRLSDASYVDRNKKLPVKLTRGWRPATNFRLTLFLKHPNFAWAHPRTLSIESVPAELSVIEVESSIANALQAGDRQCVDIVAYASSEASWVAILQFADDQTFAAFKKRASSSHGIPLFGEKSIPDVESRIATTKAKLEEAEAQCKVYPSVASERELLKAKKALDRARLGLCIAGRKRSDDSCQLVWSEASRASRLLSPTSCAVLYDGFHRAKNHLEKVIRHSTALVQQGEQKLHRLGAISSNRVDVELQSRSAFESLQALSDGNREKTMCAICLGHLGNDQSDGRGEDASMVAMTRCGHLFCFGCLETYVDGRYVDRLNLACPNCRKAFRLDQVIRVDPSKTSDVDSLQSKRKEAKLIVMRASRMLDESNGQLDAEVWEKLYLASDVPQGADRSRHPRHTAIPGHVLAHLRRAVGLPLDSKPAAVPSGSTNACLSSKLRALLSDLPLDERSVVFSASKASVNHLMTVFQLKGIGCRALFTGQNVDDTESAVNEWKSSILDSAGVEAIPFPVLVVQAGAAASGLTLTSACKMFFLEPLVRQEEESQALGRCHRYGQTKAVHCKCYYTPVSVESRLLEWRKRAVSDTGGDRFADADKHVVFSRMRGIEDDEQDTESTTESEEETEDLTRFLLGLRHHSSAQAPNESSTLRLD